jgi:hypothetical protein
MTPATSKVLRDLEQQAIKADRSDILVDVEHISFLMDHVCHQLGSTNNGRQPESAGSEGRC